MNTTRGFSLIEMMVAVAILVFIVAIVLTNHQRFNSSVLLSALAYDVALSIREAQVYGLSVRDYGGQFNVGYGVHFATPDSFFLFADRDRSRTYNAGDTTISTYTLRRGHTILRFCGTAGAVERCSDSPSAIDHLDVVFVRPNPDAWLSSDENAVACNGNNASCYSAARVVVTSPGGTTRSIHVVPTGQISVKNP